MSVIDAATSAVTATIPVGHGPGGVAVDPAAGTVYVTNSGGDTVSVIDAATGTVTPILVGTRPVGVAVDPAAGTVYVANSGNGTVSVIDAATSSVTATTSVGGDPWGVAVDPAAGTVYVTNDSYPANNVWVIDAEIWDVTATITVGTAPYGVAIDPAAGTAYVTNNLSQTVSVISGLPTAPALAAPSGLAAAVAGPVSGPPSGVMLTWTDNATAATLVRVERASGPGFSTGVTYFSAGPADSTYTDTNVVEGATYYYRVRAENHTTASSWSDPVSLTFTTVPAAPARLTAAVTGPVSGPPAGVSLHWTDTTGGALVTHMEVRRATNRGFTTGLADFPLSAAATSYTDSSAVQGTTYYYRVRAENEASNSAWSNTVSVLYTTVPAAPARLAATLAWSSVSLNWKVRAGAAPATRQRIERATNSAFTRNVTAVLVGPALRTYTDTNVARGTTYYYRVRAENKVSNSAWSNVASILTPWPATAAPANLTARAVA